MSYYRVDTVDIAGIVITPVVSNGYCFFVVKKTFVVNKKTAEFFGLLSCFLFIYYGWGF